jgi:hypothetical protein
VKICTWRHCERSEAIHPSATEVTMDCFAEFIIGRRFAPTRWLAMTGNDGDRVVTKGLN